MSNGVDTPSVDASLCSGVQPVQSVPCGSLPCGTSAVVVAMQVLAPATVMLPDPSLSDFLDDVTHAVALSGGVPSDRVVVVQADVVVTGEGGEDSDDECGIDDGGGEVWMKVGVGVTDGCSGVTAQDAARAVVSDLRDETSTLRSSPVCTTVDTSTTSASLVTVSSPDAAAVETVVVARPDTRDDGDGGDDGGALGDAVTTVGVISGVVVVVGLGSVVGYTYVQHRKRAWAGKSHVGSPSRVTPARVASKYHRPRPRGGGAPVQV